MSVVPYSTNSESRIIASLPVSNSLVAYNKSNNSLEVINNIGDRSRSLPSPTYPFDDEEEENKIKCPHCGFAFDLEEDKESESGRRGSNSARVSPHSTAAYMDNDYFKLLQLNFAASSTNTHFNQRLIGNEESHYVKLSESLFTQGYFDKFFKILKKIGTGSNGSVYKVEHSLNNLTIGVFALKKIGIGEDLNNLANTLKEVKFLYNLTAGDLYDNVVEDRKIDDEYARDLLMAVDGGRHLVKYNHVWLEVDKASTFGPKIPCLFILFEYCGGGDLENLINNRFNNPRSGLTKADILRIRRGTAPSPRKYLNNFEIFKIFKDICFGVYQLHKSHIVHRDLKPSNCLLKQKLKDSVVLNSIHDLEKFPDVVVSDFGESAIEGTGRDSSGYTGTLEFTSPELLFRGPEGTLNNFDKKSDVYSMGMILYFICFNRLPYKSGNQVSVKAEIEQYHNTGNTDLFLFGHGKGKLGMRPVCSSIDENEDSLLIDFIDLIEMMCDADPEKRPGVDQIIIFLVKDVWTKLDPHSGMAPSEERKSSVETIALKGNYKDEESIDRDTMSEIKTTQPAAFYGSLAAFVVLSLVYFGFSIWKYICCFILGIALTHSI